MPATTAPCSGLTRARRWTTRTTVTARSVLVAGQEALSSTACQGRIWKSGISGGMAVIDSARILRIRTRGVIGPLALKTVERLCGGLRRSIGVVPECDWDKSASCAWGGETWLMRLYEACRAHFGAYWDHLKLLQHSLVTTRLAIVFQHRGEA